MKKPLHKNPVFWCVTLVIVAAIDIAQIAIVGHWLRSRAASTATQGALPLESRVQPRIIESRLVGVAAPSYHAKPGEWEVPEMDPSVLDNVPPQVKIVPAKFDGRLTGPNSRPQGGWGMTRQDGKAVGVGMTVPSILQTAYSVTSRARIVFPGSPPTELYDYIANLPSGSREALQEEIRKQVGLTGETGTSNMDALVMRLDHADAPDLKPVTNPPSGRIVSPSGIYHTPYATMPNLARYFENVLRIPVLDQTGLTGHYDIQFPIVRAGPGQRLDPAARIEQTRKNVLEHLGIDLVSTNTPVEVLFVKKVDGSKP